MKRQSILFILGLLLTLFICCGCSSSDNSANSESAAAAEEAAAVTEEAAGEEAAAPIEAPSERAAVVEEAATEETATEAVLDEPAPASDVNGEIEAASPEELEKEIIASQKASNSLENIEDVVGIFEGLEDNHTAIFSFEGAETAFYFEDPAVQTVLYEAVLGSPYTLSYHFDDSLGLNVIYKISE